MPVKTTVAKPATAAACAALVSTAIRRQFGSCGDSTALASLCTKNTTPMHDEQRRHHRADVGLSTLK